MRSNLRTWMAMACGLALCASASAAAPSGAKEGWMIARDLRPRNDLAPVRVRVARGNDGSLWCGTQTVPMHEIKGVPFDFELPFRPEAVSKRCVASLRWESGSANPIETCYSPGGRTDLERFLQRCLSL